MKTVLQDRILWYDGTNEVAEDKVCDLFLHGVRPHQIVSSGPEIDRFNLIADEEILLSKTSLNNLSKDWQLPPYYLSLDLRAYCTKLLESFLVDKPKASKIDYPFRLEAELNEIYTRDLQILFKSIIFVVDKFKSTDTLWGVGRGSSCASLILFLIGLHKVDPVKYNIPMSEFFHD
jgi:DNA polymerase III alpha subunit